MSITATAETSRDRDVLLEQYKIAVEMAAQLSARRQEANKFFMGLISTFGISDSLLDKVQPSLSKTTWQGVLPALAVAWCVVWWFTIRSHRRINKAKWYAIYELERYLPVRPFRLEQAFLSGQKERNEVETENTASNTVETRGSFVLSKLELLVPVMVGLIFFFRTVYLLTIR